MCLFMIVIALSAYIHIMTYQFIHFRKVHLLYIKYVYVYSILYICKRSIGAIGNTKFS